MIEDTIYARVFDAILAQELVPKKKISEEELASVFDVSRTIIRKVLLRLSHDGAIELHRNRGAYVASPSVDDVRKVFEARRVIESGAIAIACRKATPESILMLRDIIDSEHCCRAKNDRAGRIRLSGEFHLAIVSIADNKRLVGFLRQLVIQTSLARAAYELKGVSPCSTNDHELLVEAIERGDATAAERLTLEHLHAIEAELDLTKSFEDLQSIFAANAQPK